MTRRAATKVWAQLERALDPLFWAWCWLAYWLVIYLPSHRRWVAPLWLWLLPYAGFYGFHEPWMPWRWSERHR